MRLVITTAAIVLVSVFAVSPATAAVLPSGVASEEQPVAGEGGIGIRLLDIPVATQNDPRARSYIVDSLPPGTTIERRVEISNKSDSTQSVAVYAGSARIDAGAFVGDQGAAVNDLTSWTTISDSQLALEAGATAEVTVTVAVPADASGGERYAAIWAEIRAPNDGNTAIDNASRVGIRMYLSIHAGNAPAAEFTIDSLKASRTSAGLPQVTATVTNTGGRALDILGSLSLSEGPSGLSAGPFPTEAATTLAPGDKGDVVVTLGKDLPDGPWTAALTLQSGLLKHDISAPLTFPPAGESVAVPTVDDTNVWPIVIGSLGVLVVMAVIAMLLLLRKRRRSQRRATTTRNSEYPNARRPVDADIIGIRSLAAAARSAGPRPDGSVTSNEHRKT